MGFTPQQVGAMSHWQFMTCAEGWAKAHSPEAAKRSNDEPEFSADLDALYDSAPTYLH